MTYVLKLREIRLRVAELRGFGFDGLRLRQIFIAP